MQEVAEVTDQVASSLDAVNLELKHSTPRVTLLLQIVTHTQSDPTDPAQQPKPETPQPQTEQTHTQQPASQPEESTPCNDLSSSSNAADETQCEVSRQQEVEIVVADLLSDNYQDIMAKTLEVTPLPLVLSHAVLSHAVLLHAVLLPFGVLPQLCCLMLSCFMLCCPMLCCSCCAACFWVPCYGLHQNPTVC